MNEASFSKRVFALAVVAMTILWSVGAFVAPLLANAQVSLSEGDLIKGESFSTVYYFDGDARWAFADEGTFFSWYTGFSGVTEISDAQLQGISLTGNVVRRPGSRWIKITSDPAVYTIGPDGMLRHIESEEVAEALYGSSAWNTFIDDVHDTSFADYDAGAALMTADALHDGALVSDGTDTYLMWGGELRMVSSAGMSANGLQSAHVMNTTVDLSGLDMGADLNGLSAEVSDTIQMAEGDATPIGGDFSVSLASSTPASLTLPAGANAVPVTSFTFRADDAAELNALTVSMEGVSASGNVENVYLYEGTARLTEGRSVNSATREATFSNLGLDFAAGESRTLTVRIESAAAVTSGQTVAFGISDADAVTAGGDVSGSFPLTGNLFTFSSEPVGTVTVYKSGSLSDPQIGEQDAPIAQLRIEAETEAASCEYFRFEVDNSADHSDYRLWQNDVELASGVEVDNDGIAFDLSADPFVIGEGDDAIFKVTADTMGDNGDEIKVFFDRDTDVMCAGGDFGFNMLVDRGDDSGAGNYDGTTCTSSAGNCSYTALEGGDITFTFNGPSAADKSVDSGDSIFMEFALSSGSDITIDSFPIHVGSDDGDGDDDPLDNVDDADDTDNEGLIRGSAVEANLQDIKIINVDTGLTVMGPLELSLSGDDAYQTIQFTEDIFVAGGTTLNLAITADIDNNAPTTAGDNFYGVALDLNGSGATFRIEDVNGDAVAAADISPTTDINGNTFTLEDAAIAIALSSSPSSATHTYVQGASDVNALGLTFSATAEDITVTQVSFTAYGDDDDDGATGPAGDTDFDLGGDTGWEVEDYFASCSVYDGSDNLLDGPVSPTNDGEDLLFDDIRWTVAADQVGQMNLVCNLHNPSEGDYDQFAFNIVDATTDVVAQDEDGADVTPSGNEPNGDINGPGVANVVIGVNTAGTLTMAVHSSSPDSEILLAGTTGNFVSAFRFDADNEDFLIETLSFTETQGPTDDVVSTGDIYTNNIERMWIEYPDVEGNIQTANTVVSGGVAKFGGLNFYVEAFDTGVVDVLVDIPELGGDRGQGDATSGEKLLISLTDDGDAGGVDDHFRAVAQGSDTVLDGGDFAADVTPTEAAHIIRETMPTITKHGSSPVGTSVAGNGEVFRFEIAATEQEDVIVSQIMFEVNAGSSIAGGVDDTAEWFECDVDDAGNGLLASNWSLYNDDDTGTQLEGGDSDWTIYNSNMADCTAGAVVGVEDVQFARLRFATETDRLVIPAGDSEIFQLWVNTTGAVTGDDTFQITIPSDPIADWLTAGAVLADGGDATGLATTVVTDGSATAFTHGDIVCFSGVGDNTCDAAEEIGLVTNVDDDTNTDLYVYRGYLGRDQQAIADDSVILQLPSAFVWADDGDQDDDTDAYEDEVAGAYLVDSLPLVGGVLSY